MNEGDADHWDWQQPYQPVPAELPPPRSPYSPSLGTKILLGLSTVPLIVAGLLWGFRYDLGLADGTYRFMTTQPGTSDVPVTYQSCQPIKYVVNDAQAIPGGQQLIEQAIREVTAATGLSFVFLGDSNLTPGRGQVPGATLLIAWTDDTQVPRLLGTTVGVGGSSAVRLKESGNVYYFSGEISLDAPDLLEIFKRDGPLGVRAVIMHELAHVVGLDHVDDSNELMNQTNIGKTDFGPGDLHGLALLGQGGCEENL